MIGCLHGFIPFARISLPSSVNHQSRQYLVENGKIQNAKVVPCFSFTGYSIL